MKKNFEKAFSVILEQEGGYVHHPKDPGGPTNMGVTQRAWENYVGRKVTEGEMRALTPDVVKPFYKKMYWDKIRGDDLPSGVDLAAFDLAVNSGSMRAARTMQNIAGAIADGIIGPKSLEAIRAVPATEMVEAIGMDRLNFLQRLPTWGVFGKGWGRRVEEVSALASKMALSA